RSRTGSVRFSADDTRSLLAELGLRIPTAGVPTLRLVWPSDTAPAPGSDTEVVLGLRPGIDTAELLDGFRREAPDLLLELPALATVGVDGTAITRTETLLGSGLWEIRIDGRCWWEHRGPSARWLVPVVDGEVVPVREEVLRAPTRSDEELSLPAIVVADVPMQPDRRRLLPAAHVEDVARGYAEFVRALPAEQRLELVPVPGFARSDTDRRIREAVLEELRTHPWLPAADGGPDLLPDRATALPGLTADLADALADVVPGLVPPALCGPRHAPALASVDVHRIGPARVADLLAGHDREPRWWYRLYEALTPLVVDAVVAEELA
ncbi:ATP-binding protein, partial [Rhodococcus sp. CC-R104]|nr:ATP-binding protein [Rhodococcus sp. CC-R104]